jgi:hypothetical protein
MTWVFLFVYIKLFRSIVCLEIALWLFFSYMPVWWWDLVMYLSYIHLTLGNFSVMPCMNVPSPWYRRGLGCGGWGFHSFLFSGWPLHWEERGGFFFSNFSNFLGIFFWFYTREIILFFLNQIFLMPQYENSPQKTADWEGIVWLIN